MSYKTALVMKTKRFISIVIATLILLVITPFTDNSLMSQEPDVYPEYDWSLLYPDGFDELDIIDGGDLEEASITCSGEGYGRCYYPVYIWKASTNMLGEYKCLATGNPLNYCPHILIKIYNAILDIL